MSASVRFAERHGVLALGDFHRLDGVLRHVEAAHRPQPDPRLCERIDAHASLRFVLNTVGGRLPVLHVFCRPVGMLAEVSISSTTSAQERIRAIRSVRSLPKFAKKHLESAGISIRFRVVKDAGTPL